MKRLAMYGVMLTAFLIQGAWNQAQEPQIAGDPKDTQPLQVGAVVPDVEITGMDGRSVKLSSLYRDKPLVLVFFRGGWCPICTRHTQELIKIYPEIQKHGAEMIGISPDNPANSKSNHEKNSVPFAFYSDAQVVTSSAFGLTFRVDDQTVVKYKGFGIDLEKASGFQHHALPIPAIFIVDQQGRVVFAHSNPDYRERLDPRKILVALEELPGDTQDDSQKLPAEPKANQEKLTILWTSGDPEVAHRMVLMYAKAAKSNQWFDDVRLIIWGPSARLVAADKEIQAKLKEMKQIGMVVEACVVCADSYGVSDRLRELGIEVKPMGKPLSNTIREKDSHIITF
ncbi:redoxin domain-containing protein [Pirellulaceae bacterium SH449]